MEFKNPVDDFENQTQKKINELVAEIIERVPEISKEEINDFTNKLRDLTETAKKGQEKIFLEKRIKEAEEKDDYETKKELITQYVEGFSIDQAEIHALSIALDTLISTKPELTEQAFIRLFENIQSLDHGEIDSLIDSTGSIALTPATKAVIQTYLKKIIKPPYNLSHNNKKFALEQIIILSEETGDLDTEKIYRKKYLELDPTYMSNLYIDSRIEYIKDTLANQDPQNLPENSKTCINENLEEILITAEVITENPQLINQKVKENLELFLEKNEELNLLNYTPENDKENDKENNQAIINKVKATLGKL